MCYLWPCSQSLATGLGSCQMTGCYNRTATTQDFILGWLQLSLLVTSGMGSPDTYWHYNCLDSNFKMTRFRIQNLNWARFRIQNFSYFWDSNFKPLFWDSFFKHAGIQDSNLKLMGFKIQIWAYRALYVNKGQGSTSAKMYLLEMIWPWR